MNISRRFFLGGAISLVAVQTFKPSVALMSNLPTITGDGIACDAAGLEALFRNDPVIFKKDQIAVEDHKGITFHKGRFAVGKTINVPKNVKIEIERAIFVSKDLTSDTPFFYCEDFSGHQFSKPEVVFEFDIFKYRHQGKIIEYADCAFDEEKYLWAETYWIRDIGGGN